MLDAHQLNVFVTAAETLNFTESARKLHMTQPSISQHIRALENQFGLRLFSRKGRHLELTDAGRELLPLASEMIRMSIRIEETMESLKGQVYGHLIVGCSTTPGKYILPKILAKFHEYYPQVRISCNVNNQVQTLKMLSEGDVHIALTGVNMENTSNAILRPFIKDPITLIVPNDHPWAKAGTILPQDLLQENFIMREENSGTFMAVEKGLAKTNVKIHHLKILLTLGNSEAIALAVQERIGVGFVSQLVVETFSQMVKPVHIRGVEMYQNIWLGSQTRRPASAAQTAFWKFAEQMDANDLI